MKNLSNLTKEELKEFNRKVVTLQELNELIKNDCVVCAQRNGYNHETGQHWYELYFSSNIYMTDDSISLFV